MTLNAVAFILRYFTEFDRLAGRLRFGAEYPVPVIFLYLKLIHAAVARSLCDSSASGY